MILQALVAHYEDLVRQDKLSRPGWNPVKVSYALELDLSGQLLDVVSLKTDQLRGKKTVSAPREFPLPAPVKRTVGIAANFLCDHSGYLLGVDNKGKPQRSLDCFAACRDLHLKLLEGVESPAAAAVREFFRHWSPQQAADHPALAGCWEDVTAGGNLIFLLDGRFVHEDPCVRDAWQRHYDADGECPVLPCLVTGRTGSVAQLHPSIKGIPGAQSSGASLVSFNADSFCSYGRDQGLNAPTSTYAAFAYGAALNHLIADREHTVRLGDTTVLVWASGGEPAYQDVFCSAFFGTESSTYSQETLQNTVRELLLGHRVKLDEALLDPDRDFYILGLSPNAARLSVRFFLRSSFGNFLRNVNAHLQRLEIARPNFDRETPTLWRLLNETVNQNARDKAPSPVLAGELLRAVLDDTRYPATLLNGVILRIRADHRVTPNRAAILKAYYLKNTHTSVPKEVLTVSLNPACTDVPYTLGRLFSVLENIQSAANPNLNTTIKDKYFNSASATPATVFPILVNLAQKHLRKMDVGLRIKLDTQLTEVMSILGEHFPTRLDLHQQGSFQLGYYHQTQARYKKNDQ